MTTHSPSHLYLKLHEALREAEKGMENSIEAHAQASDVVATLVMDYRRARAESIRRLKGEGMPTTLIPDLARGDTAALKKDLLLAERDRNRARNLIELYQTRINDLKFTGRKIEESHGIKP